MLCVLLCMCGICVGVCLFEGRSMEDDAPRKRVSVGVSVCALVLCTV